MLQNFLDRVGQETGIAVQIELRDFWKRLAGIVMITLFCEVVGASSLAWALLAAVLVIEYGNRQLLQHYAGQSAPYSTRAILLLMLSKLTLTCLYMQPALILAVEPRIPLLLVAYMWIFGASVHITNTFAALPINNTLQMVPTGATILTLFAIVSGNHYGISAPQEWLAAAALVPVYFANTVQTMTMQKDTQARLDQARAEAVERLQALEHLARHDPLTDCLNRHAFDNALADLLMRPASDRAVAVFLIDLDGFKPINDTYGHAAGDAILVEIARRLKALAGEEALIARLGGDEFIIGRTGFPATHSAMHLARAMVDSVSRPFLFEGTALTVGASVGVALSGLSGNTVNDLCAAADQAMYRCKGSALRTMLHQPEAFARRLTPTDRAELIAAIESGEIQPYYQPKVHLATGRIIGLEALARWQHPSRGLILPGGFLTQIDSQGLQAQFMLAIASRVLTDVGYWLKQGLDPGQVSINLTEVALATRSARQELEDVIAGSGAAARHLTLEITENVFIARAGDAMKSAIAAFRAAGARISLDDFGTGFASFQHLRQFVFDELKIAPGFVADLDRDAVAEVLVKGFLGIAAGLGVSVIAEGVETEEQRRILMSLGATRAQGWLFSRAVSRLEIEALLAQDAPFAIPATPSTVPGPGATAGAAIAPELGTDPSPSQMTAGLVPDPDRRLAMSDAPHAATRQSRPGRGSPDADASAPQSAAAESVASVPPSRASDGSKGPKRARRPRARPRSAGQQKGDQSAA